ncbi:MAG TPA: thioredoxin domain-containing protein [Candidatus Edwardsbacteria bacterium]|nr:thioredoxin domain-containing protein [Candidatus Edwardsbacteria bacterium]
MNRQAAQDAASEVSALRRIPNVNVGRLPPQGSPDAKVKIVEFGDFQCPYCKQWNDTTYPALQQKYGDKIVLYFREYPLSSIHPQAMDGAVTAECANDQGKFWEMHDAMYKTQDTIGVQNSRTLGGTLGLDTKKFNDCLANNPFQAQINGDILDGVAYGVAGTPTFFINGVRLLGALPLERFTAVIDSELAK